MSANDFEDALQSVRDDETAAMWARLDVLEELVNYLYDRLHIVYEGETEEER